MIGGRKMKLENATQVKWQASPNVSQRSNSRTRENPDHSKKDAIEVSLRKRQRGGNKLTNVVFPNNTTIMEEDTFRLRQVGEAKPVLIPPVERAVSPPPSCKTTDQKPVE
jgi:hypothetical protein